MPILFNADPDFGSRLLGIANTVDGGVLVLARSARKLPDPDFPDETIAVEVILAQKYERTTTGDLALGDSTTFENPSLFREEAMIPLRDGGAALLGWSFDLDSVARVVFDTDLTVREVGFPTLEDFPGFIERRDLSFGGADYSWAVEMRAGNVTSLLRVDGRNGKLSPLGSMPSDFFTSFALDSGDIMFVSNNVTSGRTVLNEGIAGSSGKLPQFIIDAGDSSASFIAREVAGNVIATIQMSASDILVRTTRPNEEGEILRSVSHVVPSGHSVISAVTEVNGIGFALVYGAISPTDRTIDDAEIVLFDYEGDLLARRILAEPIAEIVTELNVTALDRRPDDPVRLMVTWNQGEDAPENPAGIVAIAHGKFFTFSPQIEVIGTELSDHLTGLDKDDEIRGFGGNDLVTGRRGSDVLSGNSGNDTVSGGMGNDRIFGGLGTDDLFGGQGDDRLEGGGGVDTLTGGDGEDTLAGGAGSDLIFGGRGDDILTGGAISDELNGGNGQDILQGGKGGDVLSGGTGKDSLFGNSGLDLLNGGSGRDVLDGGHGQDTLTGGKGADTFVFSSAAESNLKAGADRITDFSRAQRDRIDLSDIDAVAGRRGDQDFSFIGTKAFSGLSGELRFDKAGQGFRVEADVDGDSLPDMLIFVHSSLTALRASDFIL